MPANTIKLDASARQGTGKSASRRLRKLSEVPAIIYGGKKEPVNIGLAANKLRKAMEQEAFYSQMLDLNLTDITEQVIVKSIHRHPYKAEILHVDFMRVSATDKIIVHVPLHFLNEKTNEAVTKQGGIISHHMVELEVKCQAGSIPQFIEVDIKDLAMGQSLHLGELSLPSNIEVPAFIRDPESKHYPVVAIHPPKASVEEEETTTTEETTEDTTTAKPAEDAN